MAQQDSYPSKPIALIVPFPPGGVADIVARPVADAMGRFLNVPVVIENKAGAGGGIGMGFVAKARADGYTLLLALSSISILPEADKVTGRAPPRTRNSSRQWRRSKPRSNTSTRRNSRASGRPTRGSSEKR